MAAVDNIFLTGKTASLKIQRKDDGAAAIAIPCTSSTIATKMETPEASNYNSLGFVELVSGIQSAEITVEAVYDKTQMPVIFAGMKADVEFVPDGNRTLFAATAPTVNQPILESAEYLAYEGTPLSFVFPNCTITSVTYDVAVRDVQKFKVTLVPSSAPGVDFGTFAF
jgi:hypothetical protein